jgi:hypothetical protein
MLNRISSALRLSAIFGACLVVLGGLGLANISNAGASQATSAGTATAALCLAQPQEGTWVNVDSATRSVTRAEVRFACNDTNTSHEVNRLHLWGKCHPTDCDWGTIPFTTVNYDGKVWVRADYHPGFATKSVWATTYEFSGKTSLRVYVWTHFTDGSGRADYASDEWFARL